MPGMAEAKRGAEEFTKVRAVWQFFEAEAEVHATFRDLQADGITLDGRRLQW
jgi:hypothetical protein